MNLSVIITQRGILTKLLENMQNYNTSSIDLWAAFQTGEERAFHHLYATYYNDLFNYCYGILKNRTAAEDCLQDFFVHLWKKRQKIAPKTTIKVLLIGMLRNFTLDFIRKDKCRNKHNSQFSLENETPTHSIEQDIIQSEIMAYKQQVVANLINTLSTQQREALFLRYYENMDISEIADTMGLSYAATAKHLSRASKALEEKGIV
jgi:RNA polymerase sigma factor (sigma-70 family)